MATPYLAEIKLVSFNFPPKGWAFCDGQILPINENQAIFSLLGTTYGGDGIRTFALPNLQGRVPLHFGSGIPLGQAAGEYAVTLTTATMPAHAHQAQGVSTTANAPSPAAKTWAASIDNPYSNNPNIASAPMNAASVSQVGASQPHENRQPFLVLNYVIALEGIFPPQN